MYEREKIKCILGIRACPAWLVQIKSHANMGGRVNAGQYNLIFTSNLMK